MRPWLGIARGRTFRAPVDDTDGPGRRTPAYTRHLPNVLVFFRHRITNHEQGHRQQRHDPHHKDHSWTAKKEDSMAFRSLYPDPSPKAPSIGIKELAWQFYHDIFGKEVQDATSYSYVWLADQIGHVCIGIILTA